ncbi:uncharacterized protein LOC135700254 [Ochlerotatus camptorhynchus]|uniref:uncharacterized protein LOC135700254 n=1 Tax=Ochlerotatus camptorhynchus TaxID=644619 RepID=UPI0031D01F59
MRCIIPSCGMDLHRRKEHCGFSSHRLPKNAKKRLAWLKMLDPSGTQYSIVNDARVCSRHFLESDFYEVGSRRKLHKGAVPSRRLGPAAKLPATYIPEQSHCVFLDESSMVCPVQRSAPVTLHSTAIEAMQEAESSTGEKRVKTIRYAGDLRDDEVPFISPEEAQEILPKIYKQLHRTKMRLSCYKQQNLRLRKKVEQLKEIIIDLRDEHDGVKSKRDQLVSELKIEPTQLSEGFDE